LESFEYGLLEVKRSFFFCFHSKLKSLKGSPKIIRKSFCCYNNKLKSLEHGPEIVYKDYICFSNQIRTFKGFTKKLGGEFGCKGNSIYNIWILFENKDLVDFFNEFNIIREDVEEVSLTRLNMFLSDIEIDKRVNNVKGYRCVK